MNKDVMIGNKIIYQKMHRKERLRHLSKLSEIRSKPSSLHYQEPNFFKQTLPNADSEKHLDIERNNIALFNKIASILKERPKVQFPKTRTFVKSLDRALYDKEKKMGELKQKNQFFLKRLNKQQPTIKNDILFRDRVKHERYLSFIGKYPFRPYRRTQTQFQINDDDKQEVYHEKSLDFDIKIIHKPETDQYIFTVKDLIDKRQYGMAMESQKFREEFVKCQLSYERMIGRLRMQKTGEMNYIQLDIGGISQQKIVT